MHRSKYPSIHSIPGNKQIKEKIELSNIFQRKPRKAPHPQTPSNAGRAGCPTPLARSFGSSSTRWTTVGSIFKVATVHQQPLRRKTPIRRTRSPWRPSTKTRSWTRCPASRRPLTRGVAADWRALRRLRAPARKLEARSSWRRARARHLRGERKPRTRTRKICRRNRRRSLSTRTPTRSILVSALFDYIVVCGKLVAAEYLRINVGEEEVGKRGVCNTWNILDSIFEICESDF